MATLADLPPIPVTGWGDGVAWAEESRGWVPVTAWGRRGWALAQWPDIIVMVTSVHARTTRRRIWGVATYVHGDVSIAAFDSEAEAAYEIDVFAAWYWRGIESDRLRPPGVPHGEGPLGEHLCGPDRDTSPLVLHAP